MHRRALLTTGLAAALAAPALGQPVRQMRRAAPSPPLSFTGETAEVASTVTGALPTVEVTLNGGGVYRFGIDTGAQGYGRVNAAVAERLGLAEVGRAMSGDPSGLNRQERRIFATGSLGLGGVTAAAPTLTEMAVLPGDVGRLDGIIGYDLFQGFVFTLDYPARRVRLRRGELPEADGRRVFATGEGPAPVIPLMIGPVALPTTLDVGQGIAPLIVPEALLPQLPTRGEPRVVGMGRTASQAMQIRAVTLTAPVRLGALTLPITEAAYPAIRDTGNLGSRGLQTVVLEIDRTNRRVRLTQA